MLFDPLTIRRITLKNRVMMSPMCQYSAQDGVANDWHFAHYGARAAGGVGLILVEATAVEPRGRITAHDLGIWNDAQIDPLSRIVKFIESQGAVPGIQIAHAGRKASVARPWDGGAPVTEANGGWKPIAPSPLVFDKGHTVPEELTTEKIKAITVLFVKAAQRARQAGFKVIELHAAHGYLLHEFLSPVSNKRQDNYGGSLENRMRLVLETAAALRETWPKELPVFTRISASDWLEPEGWTLEQSVALSKRLKDIGIDLIDCSSAGMTPDAKVITGAGYQTAFAQVIRKEAGIMTGAVGMITSAPQAEHVLKTGQADLAVIGRALLKDPYWPLHAASELKAQVIWPSQYQRAV